jgi:hypothetical protein
MNRLWLVAAPFVVSSLLAQTPGQVAVQDPAQDPANALVIGTVVDGSNGKPVAGAIVSINGGASAVSAPPPGAARAGGPPAPPTAVLTGADGRFLFTRLRAGVYTFDGEKAGYVRGGVNSIRPGMLGGAVALQAGEQRGDLVVRIWKAAAMGGVVLDDAGEPAIGVEVRFVRRLVQGGRTVWNPAGISTVRTDDRGMYRVAGVTPGDYIAYIPVTQVTMPSSVMEEYQKGQTTQSDTSRAIMSEMIRVGGGAAIGMMMTGPGASGTQLVGDNVVSSVDGMPSPTGADGGPTFAYATTYFPASATLAGATQIKLASGDERYDINFSLRPVRTIKISGTLVGPEGPIGFTRVSLAPANNGGLFNDLDAAATVTTAAGTFTLMNVPQGQYALRVLKVPQLPRVPSSMVSTVVQTGSGTNGVTMMSSSTGPSALPPLPPDPVLWADQAVGAGNEDIKSLIITARPGIRVQGRVEYAGSAAKPDEKQIATTSIRLTPVDARAQIGVGATRVSPTGELTSQGFAPGRYYVSASPPFTVSGWTLASVMHGGVDVSMVPLDLTSADVSDLVITFTDQKTTLTGVVRDDTGNPDAVAMALVFPADTPIVADEPMNSRRVRTARSNSKGKFTLMNLPPGDYYVIAIPADEDRWSEPLVLQSLKAQASRVTVAYGQPASQDLVTKKVR